MFPWYADTTYEFDIFVSKYMYQIAWHKIVVVFNAQSVAVA